MAATEDWMISKRTPRVADLVAMARNPRASVARQHAAFTKLVERFEQMAFTTALAASPDVEHARDAVQEAFLASWRMLPKLREPAAFGGWLRRLVRTQCARDRRRRCASMSVLDKAIGAGLVPGPGLDPAEIVSRREWSQMIRRAIASLPDVECQAVTLFYLLGEPLRVVASALEVSVGQAGKLVYSARLRLRRTLPRNVTEAFLAVKPAPAFMRRVQMGVFNEFVGEYRFPNRPGNHAVIIRREDKELTSYAGGQRNVLASYKTDRLTPIEFDGEARFHRNRQGQISHFIYYEFGKRLGIARKIPEPSAPSSTAPR